MNKREKEWIHVILISFVLISVLFVMATRTVQVTANEAGRVIEQIQNTRFVPADAYEREVNRYVKAFLSSEEKGADIAVRMLDMRIPPQYKAIHLAIIVALQNEDAAAVEALQTSHSWLN
ncbi:MAG: hypothetical protein O3B64_03410 [bacterium]|nr:hypothetical protein [bacterium]MDA1024679.1 hypothetical protein [bacterium]